MSEVESIIEDQVDAVLEESPSSPQHRIILVGKLIDALESDATWVDMYGITGELVVPDIHREEDEVGLLLKEARKVRCLHCYRDILSCYREAPGRAQTPDHSFWYVARNKDSCGCTLHECKMAQVNELLSCCLPCAWKIVAASRIRIISTPFAKDGDTRELPSLYAGQPISANLTIHTLFHWGSSAGDTSKRFLLRFNVEEVIREWLVSGPKRGDFIATVRYENSL